MVYNLKRNLFLMILKSDPNVMEIFASENIRTFFCGMQNNMPLIMAQFFRKIIPFSEH